VLELMLDGERQTSVYVEILEIGHLSLEEREREVKKVKDRLKKRLERAGLKEQL
jgi:biopolymer transport protein ExbD